MLCNFKDNEITYDKLYNLNMVLDSCSSDVKLDVTCLILALIEEVICANVFVCVCSSCTP